MVIAVIIFFILMGLVALAAPQRITAIFGMAQLTPEGRNEVRAVYGGFGIAVGAVLIAALYDASLRPGVPIAVAAALFGMAAGRAASALFEAAAALLSSLVLLSDRNGHGTDPLELGLTGSRAPRAVLHVEDPRWQHFRHHGYGEATARQRRIILTRPTRRGDPVYGCRSTRCGWSPSGAVPAPDAPRRSSSSPPRSLSSQLPARARHATPSAGPVPRWPTDRPEIPAFRAVVRRVRC